MKAAEYWKRRTVDLEHLLQARTTATMVEVNRMYAQGVEQLNEQIERILRRYVKNGQISQAYALQLLSAGQNAEERQRLLEQLQQTKEPQARRELIAMLDAPAYADRISRLQALQNAIRAEAVAMGVREERLAKARLTDTLKQAYYRTIFNDQKRNGLYDFRLISDRRVQAALTHKWSGKNYSDRVWKNNAAFCKRLQRTIEVGCMTGMTLHDMEERLLEDCIGADSDSGQRYCASRLIRTEVNHFSNQGFLEGYKAAGITRYRFMATLDLRTSAVCRQLDGKTFLVEEAKAGENLPPMHPFCRSITVPVTNNRTGTRWARDPVTGQSMTVPADMTYAQWYEKYVEKRDLGLTEEEEYAINSWVSSDFYPINEKLRQGIELTNEEKKAITNLDRALEKFPRYNGPVKRSLVISDPTELRKFTNTHAVGNTVVCDAYIATTCGKTYNPDAEVQIYIPQCKNGRDIRSFNAGEQEILYPRGSSFVVSKVIQNESILKIFLLER